MKSKQPDLPGIKQGVARKSSAGDLVTAVERMREQARTRESRWLPVRHPNRDFFVCDFVDYSVKDDQASMEAPFFSLATKPDATQWVWKSKDGTRRLMVTPSVLGRATIMDKDVLIYIISQVVTGLNEGREDAKNRKVRFIVYDYLVATNRQTGGSQYEQLADALRRLKGTNIETNIETGKERVRRGFGLIDEWAIVEKSADDERMIAVEVTLSQWLYNAVQAREVLTLSPDYFRLRRPLERRLYELARKHCGQQPAWQIRLELLYQKTGSRAALKEFWRMLRDIQGGDTLPEYRMICREGQGEDRVVEFHLRDMKKLLDQQPKLSTTEVFAS